MKITKANGKAEYAIASRVTNEKDSYEEVIATNFALR